MRRWKSNLRKQKYGPRRMTRGRLMRLYGEAMGRVWAQIAQDTQHQIARHLWWVSLMPPLDLSAPASADREGE